MKFTDLSLRIEKKELEHDRRFDDLERQNQLLTAKILLMENEKIMKENELSIKVIIDWPQKLSFYF